MHAGGKWAHDRTWSGGLAAFRGVAVAQGGAVMPPIELECPAEGCTRGEDGSVYKTPPLPSGEAIQMLTLHIQLNHPQQQQGLVRRARDKMSAGRTAPRFSHVEVSGLSDSLGARP